MLDLSLVSGFDWDDGNRLKSANKHSVSMAEAEQVFADSGLLLAEDGLVNQQVAVGLQFVDTLHRRG